jgi:hypothetical protein
VAVRDGVVKDAPVPDNVPPVAAVYQSYVPPGAVAVSVAVAPEQIVVPAAAGAVGTGLTIMLTVAGLLTQPCPIDVTVREYVPPIAGLAFSSGGGFLTAAV